MIRGPRKTYLTESAELITAKHGATSWQAIYMQVTLARAVAAGGDLIEAVSLLTHARKVAVEHLDADDWTRSYVLEHLGLVLADLQQLDKAEEVLNAALDAIKAAERDAPTETFRWGAVLIGKAGVLAAREKLDDAKTAYLDGLSIVRAETGDSHPRTRSLADKALTFLKAHYPDSEDAAALSTSFDTVSD